MKLSLLDNSGKELEDKINVSKSVFGVEPNDHSIYLDVKQYLANKRQGTHCAKHRAEITGSTKKLRKQKGSGLSRVGSIKSPLFKGGGTIHGPRPRDYGFKLNKKLKQLARKSALSYKAKEKKVYVLQDISFEDCKTKNAVTLLNNLKLDNTKVLIVLPKYDINILLACRNIPHVQCVVYSDINTYSLLHAEALIFTSESIKSVEKTLS